MTKLKLVFLGLAGVVSLSAAAAPAVAQQQNQPLSVKPLKSDIYWIEGGGGNTGVIVGTTGIIAIDAKTSPESGKEMVADIAKISPKPLTHVILTHSDADHVNGLASFPLGLTIIAHEKDKEELVAAVAAGGRGAPPADHLPTMVVTKNKEKITIDGVKFELLHWAPAHTGGDLVVYLPDQKIAFTGDIAATNHPFCRIHDEKNGSSEGWIVSMKGIIALNADTYVTGHGDVQTKADLEKHLAMVEERRNKVKEMVAQGKSLKEILAVLPDAEANAPAAGGQAPFDSYTEVVYKEFSKTK